MTGIGKETSSSQCLSYKGYGASWFLSFTCQSLTGGEWGEQAGGGGGGRVGNNETRFCLFLFFPHSCANAMWGTETGMAKV